MTMSDKKILILDDSEDVREVLVTLLQDDYEHCYDVATVKEAINILNEQDIDLLILDISLPGQNGMEVLRIVADELDYAPQIIVYSGYSAVASEEEVEMDTVIYFIEKPYAPDSILPLIHRILGEAESGESGFFI